MTLRRTRREGHALLPALILLTLVASTATAFLGVAVQASEGAVARGDRFETRRAGASVNKMAAQEIWASYRRTLGDDETTLAGMRAFLTANGFAAQDSADPTRTEYLGALGLADNSDGETVMGDIVIDSVLVHREDEARATRLVITTFAIARRGVRGSESDVRETITDVFNIEPGRWSGMDYALLANNINCIMCHTEVDDARRVYGTGDDYSRAKVGSIESFQFRDDPDSMIAGTLYLGGPAFDEHGGTINDWSSMNLKAAELDDEGNVVEDLFGALSVVDLVPNDPSDPTPFGNLYTDYLNVPDQIDGELPDTFPMPFRDDGGFDVATGEATTEGAGNRIVDDNEFNATVASYTGAISGGSIGVSDTGNQITSRTDAQNLLDGNQSQLDAVTRGNVVLTGTDGDPIRIDGDVAIDGDLIISGPIEGSGSLWVRGNIYVRGDLEYNDATDSSGARLFGQAANGTANALGMTAGGNVVIGDPYRPQWGEGAPVNGDDSGGWNFTMEEAASFNRREWIKTQPELPGQPVEVAVGTETRSREIKQGIEATREVPIYEWRDTGETREVPIYEDVQVGTREEPVYEWIMVSNGRPGEYEEFTRQRVQTGTREVPVYESQQVGTRTEPVLERVQTGTREETFTDWVSYDPPRFDTWEETIYEWQTPMFPNPDYCGAGFTPRYYAFGEGDPVPIQNRDGYFDPEKNMWVSEEISGGWDESKLTLADPNDPTDPILFPVDGPIAAIETLEPSSGWMDPDVLRELIGESLRDRDADEPFKVDATVYSANSVFGLVPNDPSAGTTGEMRIQGALLASDLGLLGPGGTDVLYDPRGQAMLDIRDESTMALTLFGFIPTGMQ